MEFLLSEAELELSRLHWPVTTLGYGKRVGIWFQGCSIRCAGCCSDDTWAPGQTATPVSQLMDWIRRLANEDIQGFTISGGEPFEQPEALNGLIDQLRDEFCGEVGRDILVYSGHPWRFLVRRFPHILRKVDVVVSEPYLQHRPAAYLRGSDNQRFHCLTPLAHERYPNVSDRLPEPALQFHLDGQRLWIVGIPQPGGMKQIQQRLKTLGIELRETAWLG